jgi:predicted heme/steroid binding protein/uncharacterized membrane protein
VSLKGKGKLAKDGDTERELTPAELAAKHGAQGQPAYIAHAGKVYDVSGSAMWEGGQHMGLHRAGGDLTSEFQDAPHGEEVFERYPQVGVLAEPGDTGAGAEAREAGEAPSRAREFWSRVFKRAPLLRRHPHPMVVHFPIVFMLSATFFTVLHLLTGMKSFEVTGWHCLGGGVLFTPVAMATGLFSWWLNYQARPMRPVTIKLILSPILLATGAGAWVWRWLDPEILARLDHWPGLAYLAVIGALAPLVSAIGWYGAAITFPWHEDRDL